MKSFDMGAVVKSHGASLDSLVKSYAVCLKYWFWSNLLSHCTMPVDIVLGQQFWASL